MYQDIEEIAFRIEILRKHLHELIELKQRNLLDPEVVAVSQELDNLLNKYTKLLDTNS